MKNLQLKWKYIKNLTGEICINDIANKIGIKLPEYYTDMAIQFNGGRPNKKTLNSSENDLSIRSFLRVDKTNDPSSISYVYEIVKKINDRLFPFADDSFGNYFCFLPSSNNSNVEVVFVDMEIEKIILLSDSFESFINSLT